MTPPVTKYVHQRGKALVLTESDGTVLPEDSAMKELRTITLSGGAAVAQDADCYLPGDSVNINEQITLKGGLDSAIVILYFAAQLTTWHQHIRSQQAV